MANKTELKPGNYCGYDYDAFYTSEVGLGPRGEYYHLALVKDGKIIAFGDEQGNYAGGVYASYNFAEGRFQKEKEYIKKGYPDLYEQIKDFPLAKVYKPRNVALYRPSGMAGEYAEWAVNFYTGCSNDCDYCYCKRGVLSHVWSTSPQLKKCFKDEKGALAVFEKELNYYASKQDMRQTGVFFSFTTDPLLPETGGLTLDAAMIALRRNVPSSILTKRADGALRFVECYKKLLPQNDIYHMGFNDLAIGFTLTGHDELEKGASTNEERIDAMRYIHSLGIRTFASVEPIVDLEGASAVINCTLGFCDLYKIGLMSGGPKKEMPALNNFVEETTLRIADSGAKVYWKESVVKALGGIKFSHSAIVRADYSIFSKGKSYLHNPML